MSTKKKVKHSVFRFKLIVGGPFDWVNLTNNSNMESDEYSTIIQCNSVLCHMPRSSPVEQMKVGGTRCVRVRDQIYTRNSPEVN